MITYKSSLFVIIKNVIYGVAGGAVLALILSWFIDNLVIAIAIAAVVGLFVVYLALFGDNIKIVIDGDDLSFYKMGKLKHHFKISEVGFRAKIKTRDGDSDCNLTVLSADGSETTIDCSMLGNSRFYKLLDSLDIT